MPRNGAGTYNLVNNTWYPPVTGVNATATDWTPFISDVASALTQSVSSDGQTPFTGNLPMGNNKITGLAPGTANTDAVNIGQVNLNAGQCRLVKSGANIVLQPYQGNRLIINGVVNTIPAAGVSLAPAGSVASTLYYIYAYMVASVMTLEYSTTAHVTDAGTGVEIKSGDVTRTLVGMARPIAGPAWADTVSQRFVVSWFNRRPVPLQSPLAANTGNVGTSYSIMNNTLLLEFLAWGGDQVSGTFQGAVANNVAGMVSNTAIFVDGSATFESFTATQAYTGSAIQPVYCSVNTNALAEGYHNLQVYALQSGVSTATYLGSGSSASRCVHSATIQG